MARDTGMLVAACFVQLLSTQYEDIIDSEIPGRYHEGSVHASWGINLREDHVFEARASSCLTRHGAKGTWVRQGDVIILNQLEKKGSSDFEVAKRYVPVRFNHHLYMIAENGMPAFANEARKGFHELIPFVPHAAKISEKFEFVDSPKPNWFPCRYRYRFEGNDIKAKVVRMVDDQHAEVDLVSKSVIEPATRLGVLGPARMELQLESVNGTKGIAKVWYFEFSDRRIKVGDEFSTDRYVAPESEARYTTLIRKRKS